MHVIVCITQVPDPQAPAGSFYIPEGSLEPNWSPPAQQLVSTFDLHAVEAAACIKEHTGATVTVLSVGPPDVEVGLRRALAGGCDRAIRIEPLEAAGHDRLALAETLVAAVRRLAPVDLVLCGRMAAGWDMGHVPAILAELLDVPIVSPVIALETGEGGSFTVGRLTDDGYEVLGASPPLVLAVSNELNEPRYPTMRAVIDAQRTAVESWTLADLCERDLGHACEFVDADDPEAAGIALADLLRGRVLV
jgi:electron transfer flavoprotein beta subunit